MKTSLYMAFICISMLISSYTFAFTTTFEGTDPSTPHCSECQCTDDGAYYNDCISKRKYCQQFGNIGLR